MNNHDMFISVYYGLSKLLFSLMNLQTYKDYVIRLNLLENKLRICCDSKELLWKIQETLNLEGDMVNLRDVCKVNEKLRELEKYCFEFYPYKNTDLLTLIKLYGDINIV